MIRALSARDRRPMFAHRRELFTRLDLVFMDTTSLYFEAPAARRWASTATARITALTCGR